jgi:hypothetical protein
MLYMCGRTHILCLPSCVLPTLSTGKQQSLQSILRAVAFASAVGASVVQVTLLYATEIHSQAQCTVYCSYTGMLTATGSERVLDQLYGHRLQCSNSHSASCQRILSLLPLVSAATVYVNTSLPRHTG